MFVFKYVMYAFCTLQLDIVMYHYRTVLQCIESLYLAVIIIVANISGIVLWVSLRFPPLVLNYLFELRSFLVVLT